MTHRIMPVAMGVIMGPMMLWMLHGALTGGAASGLALAVFVGAHVLFLAGLGAAAVFAARSSPRIRARLDGLHPPSLGHVGMMLGSAFIAVLSVHLLIHGGL